MMVAKPSMASESAQLNPLRLKAMAMKMRHRVHGFQVKPNSTIYAQIGDDNASDGKVSTLHGPDNIQGLKSIFVHPFSILLVCLPLGICSGMLGWGEAWTFWLNILGIIPLAKFLGDTTEELAAAIHNDTLSGLLNATLGNAVEMILTVQTLRKGLLGIVKSSLLGSILSNLLLVLGSAFFLGGLSPSAHRVGPHHVIHDEDYQYDKRCVVGEKEQLFSVKGALVSMGLQLLACMTCALPTVFASVGSPHEDPAKAEASLLNVSRIGAVVIGISYIAYVVFQLCTHKGMLAKDDAESHSEEDEDGASLTAGVSITLMTVITIFIAVSSELLVNTIDHMVEQFGVPEKFIGVVLLPFAGNACEHASALRFGIQDRPGLVIAIAVGSSTQIALLVVPFAVLVGWYLKQPMSLDFGILNTAVLLLSVLVVLTSVIDGRSNWLKGFMLCTAYVFTSILYWYDV